MSVDQLIKEIIQRESVKDTNNPNDPGGETKFGISKRGNPDLWNPGPPTFDQAYNRYLQNYIFKPGFIQIQPDFLQAQLIDWGVTSGPLIAISHLQRLLGLKADGVIGPATIATLSKRDAVSLNNQLVDDHIIFIDRLVQKRPQQLGDLVGWHNRALLFRK